MQNKQIGKLGVTMEVLQECSTKVGTLWVVEDSPYFRMVILDAIDDVLRVGHLEFDVVYIDRFTELKKMLQNLGENNDSAPIGILADLHFPDCDFKQASEMHAFYKPYFNVTQLSFMSCNPEKLHALRQLHEDGEFGGKPVRFIEKEGKHFMKNVTRVVHSMVYR